MQKDKSSKKPDETAQIQGAHSRPSGYRMFTDAQLDEIHLASLEILRRTGVRVHETESLALLRDAGCVITDGNLVRFPPAVIENAIADAPSRIVLCNRTGEPRVYLESHRVYFGTGSDLINTLDLESGDERWRATFQHGTNAPIIADHDAMVLVRPYGDELHAYDAADGKLRWKFDLADGELERE